MGQSSCKPPSPSITVPFLLNAIRCGIDALITAFSDGIPASVERVASATVVAVSGSVDAGAQSVGFLLSADFTGTIAGAAVTGASYTVFGPFAAKGADTLGAIAYTRSAGSLTILKTV